MKNIEAFIYAIYAIEKCKKFKTFGDFGDTDSLNYMKKLYNDLSQCMVNFRFEIHDESVFLRLVDFEVDVNLKLIKYTFDTNILSSEFSESDINGNTLDLAFDKLLPIIPRSFKKSIIKEGKFKSNFNSTDITKLLDTNISHLYSLDQLDLSNYDNIFEFVVGDNIYSLQGKMNFVNIVNSIENVRYQNNSHSRKIMKMNINLNDSAVNMDFNFNLFLKDILTFQKITVDNFQSKYLENTETILNLFYTNLEDKEDNELVQHIKEINPDIYNLVKDINMEDLLMYDINVEGE